MSSLNNYLPKDLINIVEEYEKTAFDNVMDEFLDILKKTYIISTSSNPYSFNYYAYPENYDYVFQTDKRLYNIMIEGLKNRIRERYLPEHLRNYETPVCKARLQRLN